MNASNKQDLDAIVEQITTATTTGPAGRLDMVRRVAVPLVCGIAGRVSLEDLVRWVMRQGSEPVRGIVGTRGEGEPALREVLWLCLHVFRTSTGMVAQAAEGLIEDLAAEIADDEATAETDLKTWSESCPAGRLARVQTPDGSVRLGTVISAPWHSTGGVMVARIEGFADPVPCHRIKPAVRVAVPDDHPSAPKEVES